MTSTDTRKIKLADKEFDIPYLPVKKMRQVVPACSYALDAIAKSGNGGQPLSITALDYIYLAIFEAVSHVKPDLKKEDFDKWEFPLSDAMRALTEIALQTGVLVRKDDKQQPALVEGAPGEQQAA